MNTQTLNVCNKGKLPKNNAHSVSQANEVSSPEPTVQQRIVSYWFRGSMNVNPLAGNGKQTLRTKHPRIRGMAKKLTADRLPPCGLSGVRKPGDTKNAE